MTGNAFRKLALALPGVEERAHMGHPDFRVGGKIFATLGYPDAAWGMVRLPPAEQAACIAKQPDVFALVKGKWGEQGATNVRLRTAGVAAVRAALKAAHEARLATPVRQKS